MWNVLLVDGLIDTKDSICFWKKQIFLRLKKLVTYCESGCYEILEKGTKKGEDFSMPFIFKDGGFLAGISFHNIQRDAVRDDAIDPDVHLVISLFRERNVLPIKRKRHRRL